MSEHPRARIVRELGNKPVRIVKTQHGNRIYIGEAEFMHPISRDSISVAPGSSKRMNLLTLTLVVGDVSIENLEPVPAPSEDGINKGLPGISDRLIEFAGQSAGRAAAAVLEVAEAEANLAKARSAEEKR